MFYAPVAKLVKAALSKGVLVSLGSNPSRGTKLRKRGRVWFIAPVLKTDDRKRSVSSNLTASTNILL